MCVCVCFLEGTFLSLGIPIMGVEVGAGVTPGHGRLHNVFTCRQLLEEVPVCVHHGNSLAYPGLGDSGDIEIGRTLMTHPVIQECNGHKK